VHFSSLRRQHVEVGSKLIAADCVQPQREAFRAGWAVRSGQCFGIARHQKAVKVAGKNLKTVFEAVRVVLIGCTRLIVAGVNKLRLHIGVHIPDLHGIIISRSKIGVRERKIGQGVP